jgi:hypothetical protein
MPGYPTTLPYPRLAPAQGYYVIAAVRDPAKMDEAAGKLGISPKDYQAMKLECASLKSVQDFVQVKITSGLESKWKREEG